MRRHIAAVRRRISGALRALILAIRTPKGRLPMAQHRRPGTHRRVTWLQIVIERLRYSWFGDD